MVTRFQSNVTVDCSYANYMRLCEINLIAEDRQMTSIYWQWRSADEKSKEILRLMSLAETRDQPDSDSGEATW